MISHQFYRNINRGRIFDFHIVAPEKRTLDIKSLFNLNIDLLVMTGREEENPFVSVRLNFPMIISRLCLT